MKRIILLSILFLSFQNLFSQNLDFTISTPQPRLNDPFEISVDISKLREQVFKQLNGLERLPEIRGDDSNHLYFAVKSNKLGHSQIGPVSFELNGKKYTTGKISYDVVDTLPQTDNGIWFRKVGITDSTFYIIAEQKIPATLVFTKKTDTLSESTVITDGRLEVSFNEIYNYYPESPFYISVGAGFSDYRYYSSIEKKDDVWYKYNFSIAKFKVKQKMKGLKVTKDYFKDLPDGYDFKDIPLDKSL